jgi:hypothetical protein
MAFIRSALSSLAHKALPLPPTPSIIVTHLKELDDALVCEMKHDTYLPLDALGLVGICELGLVNDLDGHLAHA